MKIYRIPVSSKFQPNHQDFIWPPTNQMPGMDFGVEQDFDRWLWRSHLLVEEPFQADWMYVPIYWNRYYINNDWGGGLEALSEEVDRCLQYDVPIFTIAEADIKWLKPSINWKNLVVFCSSRRDKNGGIDIPLLCAPHPLPDVLPEKKYLASFMGNLKTDGIRIDMANELKDRTDCRVEHAGVPAEVFSQIMLESYIALCPRGQGAQSYRMYEAMQLGTTPWYISDLDCRPFKKWIDWIGCSIHSTTVIRMNMWMDFYIHSKEMLLDFGVNAREVYKEFLAYQKWCPFVIKELEQL